MKLGAFVFKDKKFYYIEGGKDYMGGGQVNRLKKTLVQRGLINYNDGYNFKSGYEIMSKEEAELKELEIVPIFLSKHIEELHKKSNEDESSSSKSFK